MTEDVASRLVRLPLHVSAVRPAQDEFINAVIHALDRERRRNAPASVQPRHAVEPSCLNLGGRKRCGCRAISSRARRQRRGYPGRRVPERLLSLGEVVFRCSVIGPFRVGARLWTTFHSSRRSQGQGDAERARIIEALGIPENRWISVVDPMSAGSAGRHDGPGCYIGPSSRPDRARGLGTYGSSCGGRGHDLQDRRFVFVGANASFAASARCRMPHTLRLPRRSATAARSKGICGSSDLCGRHEGCRGFSGSLWRACTRTLISWALRMNTSPEWTDARAPFRSSRGKRFDYELILRDSVTLLTAPRLRLAIDLRAGGKHRGRFSRVISTSHAQAGAIAALAAPHFRRLLLNPEVDLAQACRMHDALWGMWWCAAASLDDMRPIHGQSACPFTTSWSVAASCAENQRRAVGDPLRLRVAYLMHYAHGERGNAVAPLIVSLARAHASLPDRKIFAYAVQWVDESWLASSFAGSRVATRSVPQKDTYDRLDQLFEALRSDEIDVIVADVTSSIVSVIFAGRVAPAQIRLDLGLRIGFSQRSTGIAVRKRWRDCYPYQQAARSNQDEPGYRVFLPNPG